jgi:signal peptidase
MQQTRHINNDALFFDISTNSLKNGKSISFSAKGTSMYPTIKEDDILHIEPVLPENIYKRDIIFYTDNSGVVVHRLILKRFEQGQFHFFTRGDSSFRASEISRDQILGKLFCIQRKEKKLSLNNSLGYYFYTKLRCFFVRIFRKLPFGIHHKFVAVKRAIVT